MAGIGIPELLIILAIVLVLLGPGRMAGVGGALGASVRNFRQAIREEQPAEPPADQAADEHDA